MAPDVVINEKVHTAVENAIATYGAKDDELIPILSHINREIGYLPAQALEELSVQLKTPKKQAILSGQFLRDAFHDTCGKACHPVL